MNIALEQRLINWVNEEDLFIECRREELLLVEMKSREMAKFLMKDTPNLLFKALSYLKK